MKSRTIFLVNLLLLALQASLLIFVYFDRPVQTISGFGMQQLSEAIASRDVLSLRYLAETQELEGTLRPEGQSKYGGSAFRVSGNLPLATYQRILEQKISPLRFFGPVAELLKNEEFSSLLALNESSAGPSPQPAASADTGARHGGGEQAHYKMRLLGLECGELWLNLRPMIQVRSEPRLQMTVRAQSSESFASFYRLDDAATAWVNATNFDPLALTQHFAETDRFGATFVIYRQEGSQSTRKATTWVKLASKDRGLQLTKEESVIRNPASGRWQNIVTALWDLRRRPWPSPQTLFIEDHGKQIELNFPRAEEIELDSVLGKTRAFVLQPSIVVNGEAKTQPTIKIWLQAENPHAVLKAEGDLKIGHAVLELTSYHREPAP